MNLPLQIVSIGLKSLSLLGEKKQEYLSYPNAKLYSTHVDERLVIRFSSEDEMLIFLQQMVGIGVPFFDSDYHGEYSTYFYAKEFIDAGKLRGHIVRSVWKDGEYLIEETDD